VILLSRRVGPSEPPYRIFHAGASHDGDLQLGYKLVETAGAARAEAVVLERGSLSERDFKCVLGHATHVGLAPLGAPADEEEMALLASMGVPGVRFADADALPPSLLAGAAKAAWSMILSLRTASVDAAAAVLETCRRAGSGPVAFLAPDPRMMEAWRAALPACPIGLLAWPEDGHLVAGAHLIETTHRLPPVLSRRNRS
jgi:sialic acid synthase SpsE